MTLGFSEAEAHRIVSFVPTALSRPILEEFGITGFADTVSVPCEGGQDLEVVLARQPEYVAALAIAREHRRNGVLPVDVFSVVAGSSAEIDVLSRALNEGADVKGGTIATAIVGTELAAFVVR